MKVVFAIGTVLTGGKNEIRIYIKSPFDELLKPYLKKGVIVLVLIPETKEEEKITETLKTLRIQPRD